MAFRMTNQVFKMNFLLEQHKSSAEDLKMTKYTVSFSVIIVKLSQSVICTVLLNIEGHQSFLLLYRLSDRHIATFSSLKYSKMF